MSSKPRKRQSRHDPPRSGSSRKDRRAAARSPAAAASAALESIASLLGALHCGALLIDRSGRIVQVNERLCGMMQRSREQLLGRALTELYPAGDSRDAIQRVLGRFDESCEQESYLPRLDGGQLPVIISGRALPDPPPLSDHRLLTVMDISQQKRAEREAQQRFHDIAALSDTVLEQALELKRYSHELEQRVAERTAELNRANMDAIYMLAVASEAKDLDTGAHVRRIERTARLIARELGLSDAQADRVGHSAILHDVGKMHVPDEILRKSGPLTETEWTVMRQHTIIGERMLSREPFFDVARSIARSHHENWDGTGYPDALSGEAIALPARIVRVADVYDALTTTRPYKHAWSPDDAAATIERERGKSFDPEVVRSFLKLFGSGRLRGP